MNRFTFGFLGCGNMGGALAKAASKAIPAGAIAVCDIDPAKTDFLVQEAGAVAVSLSDLVEESQYLFLGKSPTLPSSHTLSLVLPSCVSPDPAGLPNRQTRGARQEPAKRNKCNKNRKGHFSEKWQ